jgi:hypothetical protein
MLERKYPVQMPLVDLGGGGGGPNIELLIYLVIRGSDQTVSNDQIQSFLAPVSTATQEWSLLYRTLLLIYDCRTT